MSSSSQDIDPVTFTSQTAYGSNIGGHDFSLVGSHDQRVKSMKMNTDALTSSIGQLLMKKWDESSLLVGDKSDIPNQVQWTFDRDELFTRIQLYSDKDRLCGIKITTNKNNYQIFVPSCSMAKHIEIPVGSGKCVGVFGQSGSYVDSLGFAMLKK